MRNLPAIEQQLSMLGWFSSDYIGILAMGLFYGLTLCSFSCLPMLTPYLFANAAAGGGRRGGFMPAFNLTAIFIITRVITYAALGAAAGGAGEALLKRLDDGALMPVSGAVIIAIALAVIFGRNASCARPKRKGARPKAAGIVHMAGLGVATSLMPCLPLTAILMLAAARGSALQGGVYGLLFGLGAASSPLYYLGGATGWLATRIRAEIPKYAPHLRKLSGVILALFGLRLILS
jgi:thiol:disulfide interchange protein DsbD